MTDRQQTSVEPRKCPFCMSPVVVNNLGYAILGDGPNDAAWEAYCSNDRCVAGGNIVPNYFTEEEAIEAWNGKVI